MDSFRWVLCTHTVPTYYALEIRSDELARLPSVGLFWNVVVNDFSLVAVERWFRRGGRPSTMDSKDQAKKKASQISGGQNNGWLSPEHLLIIPQSLN